MLPLKFGTLLGSVWEVQALLAQQQARFAAMLRWVKQNLQVRGMAT